MTSPQSSSSGRIRTVLLVALVAVLAVVAAALTVVVSVKTYAPTVRSLTPRIQVAAGSDHVDPTAGLVVRVPEGWRVVEDDLVFGSTALVPEEEEADGAGVADAGTAGDRMGGLVIVGEMTPNLFVADEPDNMRAAAGLANGMGQFFLPIPGRAVDQQLEEVSSRVGDGWAASYRVVAQPGTTSGLPEEGLVYTAVLGEGDQRFWLTYVGAPADGAMDSPQTEWAGEIVDRLRPA